jgi:hypothetical protein
MQVSRPKLVERVRTWIKHNPVQAAITGLAIVAFLAALATANEWFILASRFGLMIAGVIAVVTSTRRFAREADVEKYQRPALERGANEAATRYVLFMVLLALAASLFSASIYDDFKLIRWLF